MYRVFGGDLSLFSFTEVEIGNRALKCHGVSYVTNKKVKLRLTMTSRGKKGTLKLFKLGLKLVLETGFESCFKSGFEAGFQTGFENGFKNGLGWGG